MKFIDYLISFQPNRLIQKDPFEKGETFGDMSDSERQRLILNAVGQGGKKGGRKDKKDESPTPSGTVEKPADKKEEKPKTKEKEEIATILGESKKRRAVLRKQIGEPRPKKDKEAAAEKKEKTESDKIFDKYLKLIEKQPAYNVMWTNYYIQNKKAFEKAYEKINKIGSFHLDTMSDWTNAFKELLERGEIDPDELSKIYPYTAELTEKPEEPVKEIILEREKQPKKMSEADIEKLPDVTYKTPISPESDDMKKLIDHNYEWIYGRNLKNLKAGKDVDAGVWLTEDYLASGPIPIQKAYRSYLGKAEKLENQKRETKRILDRASASPTQKKETKEALDTAKKEKHEAMANLEKTIEKDKENKKKKLDKWLEKHDLPKDCRLTDTHMAINFSHLTKTPIKKERVHETMINKERSKIFKTFKDLIRNCDIDKLGSLEDSLRNEYKNPTALLDIFNRTIFAENIKKYIQFQKTLTRLT